MSDFSYRALPEEIQQRRSSQDVFAGSQFASSVPNTAGMLVKMSPMRQSSRGEQQQPRQQQQQTRTHNSSPSSFSSNDTRSSLNSNYPISINGHEDHNTITDSTSLVAAIPHVTTSSASAVDPSAVGSPSLTSPPPDSSSPSHPHHKRSFLSHQFHEFYVGTKLRLSMLWNLLKWALLVIPMGLIIGVCCAVLLYGIDKVTEWRLRYTWLLYLLPIAGLIEALLYKIWGTKGVGGGVNLIVQQLSKGDGNAKIPTRMIPLVFICTLLSHLCGASVGREGTAVQMAGACSTFYRQAFLTVMKYLKQCGSRIELRAPSTRTLGMASVAAGFGGVFGTPIAGVFFSMEIISIGTLATESVIPSIVAAISADWSCRRLMEVLGIGHTDYAQYMYQVGHETVHHLEIILLLKVILAAMFFGLASLIFLVLLHKLKDLWKAIPYIKSQPLTFPIVGGVLTIVFALAIAQRDYLGIGTVVDEEHKHSLVIVSAFTEGMGEVQFYSFFLKIAFTCIALSTGYKGGEVTNLFYIGAMIGRTMSNMYGDSENYPFFSSLGFVAVFAGASNTPFASTIMGVELFGGRHILYYATSCFIAYLMTGWSGIYETQQVLLRHDVHIASEIESDDEADDEQGLPDSESFFLTARGVIGKSANEPHPKLPVLI